MRIFILFLAPLLVVACRTIRPVSQNNSHVSVEKTDSVKHSLDKQKDSIFVHDSVFIYQTQRNDTIYITRDKWKTVYRDRSVLRIDTFKVLEVRADTLVSERVEQVAVVPKFYRTCTWLWWIVVFIVAAVTAFKIYRRVLR